MKNWNAVRILPATLFLAGVIFAFAAASPYREWRTYGGTPDGMRYSRLDQINKSNVKDLKVAWSFDTGDAFPGSEMQCNPIIVDGVFYATTPKMKVIALNAATGKLLWKFDPNDGRENTRKTRNRGLNHWTDGKEGRIYFAAQQWLYALDTKTGLPARDFGESGRINLRLGLGRDQAAFSISLSTPGVVYKDLLIIGSITGEDLPAAPGDIRAYDVRSGKLQWSFHTIPHPGEVGYETWPPDAWKRTGAANNWAGMALDEKRGLVFVPTGSAAFDFYGADRHGDNLFANSLIALDATTGKRVWHFQFVRHDLWDRDLPAAPSLVTIRQNGRSIDAVAQTTKSGHVFVFERETGKPVFPIEYRSVPASDVPGEQSAGKQPFPLKPPPFARQQVTEDMLTDRTPEEHKSAIERFRTYRNGGQFTPFTVDKPTLMLPGTDGGAEWGGAAFDPESGLLYVNSNENAVVMRLVERDKARKRNTASSLYQGQCASCHRADRKGAPPDFPALIDIAKKRSQSDIDALIHKGAGRMPPFPHLTNEAVRAVSRFLITGEDSDVVVASNAASSGLKYTHDGYNRFLDSEGYPAIKPPWGTLNAIDLNKGEIRWKITFGEIPELVAKGFTNTGSQNYGGPAVTAGGLLFIGATNNDRKFRAYDKATGQLLWSTVLPFAGNATPAVYEVRGRQFVVIGAGGGKSKQPSGGVYVAFALP